MNSSGKKGQFSFSPRSNLKRGRNTFHSTIDSLRGHSTTNASHRFSVHDRHNAPVPPAAISNRQTQFRSGLAERISVSKSKQPPRGSTWAATRDRVGSYIAYDDQYSKLEGRVREQASFYHLSKNLVTFGGWPIPPEILEEFDRLSQANSEVMTVSQGFLPECGHFYYSINEVIYFMNLSQCPKMQQPAPLVRVQLNEKVTKVMECRLSSNLLNNNDRDRVLVVSHYESLAFYLYHVEDGKIFLDDLHQSINLPGEIITQVVATESGEVFYVDRFGDLSMIEDKPTKRLFLFNTGNRQMVASTQQPGCLKQFISKYGQEGISDGIKFIAKSIGRRWNRFMTKSLTCKGLQIDHKRKMIFTLVEREFSKVKFQNTLSAYKMNESGGMELLQSLGEDQLFQKLEAFGLRFSRQLSRILKIKTVDEEYFPESNLQIIVANGTRIYVCITKDYIKPERTIYSPDTEILQVVSKATKQLFIPSKDNKIRSDPTNQCQLVDVAVRREQALLIYSSSSRLKSFFCSRLNASSRSTVGEIAWSSYGVNGKAYPKDIACWSMPQTCSYSRPLQKLLQYKPGYTILPVTHVHELARQVYLPPDFYLTVNDQEAEFLCRLRPIDIVYIWLAKLPVEECQNRLEQAVGGWKRVEIIAMLYIFLSDTSFEFFSTPEIEREIEEQQQRRERPESLLRAHQSSVPMIINSQKIPVLLKQKASLLIDYIGMKNQLLKEKDNEQYHEDLSVFRMTELKLQPCTTKEQALCLYISRLLRPIWNRKASELAMEETHIIRMKLQDLMRFIDETPIDYRMSETKRKEGARQPSLFEQMRNFIQRCLQLFGLLRNVSINIQCDFQQLVAQQSTFFETLLFGELKRYDVKIISTYQSEYSRLVDEKFVRIAKFYFKTLPIDNHRTLSNMCEEFGSLPSYFMEYLRTVKNLNIDTLKVQILERVDRPDTQHKRLISTGTMAEQYGAMLDMIGESSSVDDKLRYTNMAIDTVKQLLENRKLNKSDRNSYESDLKDLIQKKQLLLVQKALIDTLLVNNEHVDRLQCILEHNQIVPENLKAAVLKASDPILSLIWYLNFRPSHPAEFNVSEELDRLIECNQDNWPTDLQKNLTYVLNHIVKGGNWQLVTQLIKKLQKANMNICYRQLEDFYDRLDPSRLDKILFWVPQLLLAQGFQLEQIYDVYYKNALELSSLANDKHSRNQLIELYYWTIALQHFVRFVNLQPLTIRFRELSQKLINKEMTMDNVDTADKLRKVFSIVRPN